MSPGTFRPALPNDAHQVVRLFAVAARAACAEPTALTAIHQTIEFICQKLVPPESHTAQECHRLWTLFLRVAQLPKEALRREAGRAFCRDLDALGQKLQLAPLPEWMDLPEGLDEPHALSPEKEGEETARALPLLEVQKLAREQAGQGALKANQVVELLRAMEQPALRQWLDALVGHGELGRSDVNLLVRQLVKAEAVGPQDTMLQEVLGRLGGALVR